MNRIIVPTLLLFLPLLRLSSAAFAEPFWHSNRYDAGQYGAYPYQEYGSFDLVSPRLNILQWDEQCEHGLTLLTPHGGSVPTSGPMVLDAKGNLVWMETKWGYSENLRIQRYKDIDYLTFWAGVDDGTHGRGYYYMLDSSYEIRYVVQPAGELKGDLHEFVITPQGTALMTIYETLPWDLNDMGVTSVQGYIVDSLFQEVDIETGELIFEWRASDHFNVSDTLSPLDNFGWGKSTAFDFFHINSISKDPEGNYWISARYMCAVMCISSADGAVIHTLGGHNNGFNDLSDGAATNFTWQHHMTYHALGDSSSQNEDYITILDNADYNYHPTNATESRALKLRLNTSNRLSVELIRSYTNPLPILSHSQGSVQVLPPLSDFDYPSPSSSDTTANQGAYNDSIFVGWGHSAAYTQYDAPTGRVLCDVHFGAYATFEYGSAKSYRAFKHLGVWTGTPLTRPDIGTWKKDAASPPGSIVYASWNGATGVRSWKLQGAHGFPGGEDDASEQGWSDVAVLPKEGFEVEFVLGDYPTPDANGKVKRHGDAVGPGFTYYRVLALSTPAGQKDTRINGKGNGNGRGKGKHNGNANDQVKPNRNVLGVSPTVNRQTGSILGIPVGANSHSAAHSAAQHQRLGKALLRHKALESRLGQSDTLALVLIFFACIGAGAALGWWDWWKGKKAQWAKAAAAAAAGDGDGDEGGLDESDGLLLQRKGLPDGDELDGEEEEEEEAEGDARERLLRE